MYLLLILLTAFTHPTYTVDIQITNERRCHLKLELELLDNDRHWRTIYVSAGKTVNVYGHTKNQYVRIYGTVIGKDFCGCSKDDEITAYHKNYFWQEPHGKLYRSDNAGIVFDINTKTVMRVYITKPNCKIP